MSDGETAVVEKISELKAFRALAARLHEIIMEAGPGLQPRLWYGMPGYARAQRDPVLCFFRVDDERYVTFGLTEKANHDLDENATDQLRPSAWFLTDLDDATEDRISTIVSKAIG